MRECTRATAGALGSVSGIKNAEGKERYRLMWQATADVLREWDPYLLLAGGSPKDEFDSEISSVVAQIPRIHSATDAAHAVSRTFSSSFGSDSFSPKACSDVGAKLFSCLQERGLLS